MQEVYVLAFANTLMTLHHNGLRQDFMINALALFCSLNLGRKQAASRLYFCASHHCSTSTNMTDSNRQADALLTEHFQYTPLVRPIRR